MEKKVWIPEPGDTITFRNEIISIGGQILHSPGDKVKVREVRTTPGHYYRPIPDIWIPEKLNAIKLEGIYGTEYLPDCFEEYHSS